MFVVNVSVFVIKELVSMVVVLFSKSLLCLSIHSVIKELVSMVDALLQKYIVQSTCEVIKELVSMVEEFNLLLPF